ncbi:MAG TPA: Xaa-Pro peptidase family protein [Terriglobia bacterium]|nr:Xaa-Pro peptidase family protein [Terriglobia bacterium]
MRFLTKKNSWARFALCIAVLMTAELPIAAWDKGNLSDYHNRRAQVVRETGDGLVVLFGYNEADVAASTTQFRQNENFYYLTGWNQPNAVMLVVPGAAKAQSGGAQTAEIEREILFIPPHDFRQEKWTGPKLGPEDVEARAQTGFAEVQSINLFPQVLQEELKKFPKIYTEMTPQPESGEDCFQAQMLAKLHKLAPLASFSDLRPLLTRMRPVKSAGEIALIRKAADASVEAHLAAFKAVHPGAWEYEVAARMQYEFQRRGCEWPAYPPIVGSGFLSTVLHYDQDSHQMQSGDVVVMDVAGAYSGYASDITRTLPVNGHFTARQREIYEIVLGAQNTMIAAAKPGMTLGRGKDSLYQIAYDYLNTHGKDLHGQPLGQYFIHGLGHSVGLNVHDQMDYSRPLEPGMVITDEPGIYIPEEKLGVRIEDMLLVTENGVEVLTRRLPRTADEIEKLMAGK